MFIVTCACFVKQIDFVLTKHINSFDNRRFVLVRAGFTLEWPEG